MAQSQHGYSINEFIEKNLGRVSGMKRATAYALLERLEQKGLVEMEAEAAGNYPPRKVYSITPAGRTAFFELLQKLLVDAVAEASAADIALMFIDWLEPAEAAAFLRERRAAQALGVAASGCAQPPRRPGRRLRLRAESRLAPSGGGVDPQADLPSGKPSVRTPARRRTNRR